MKLTYHVLIIVFIYITLIYLCFAFGAWNLNPSTWEVSDRITCAILFAGGIPLACIIGVAIWDLSGRRR